MNLTSYSRSQLGMKNNNPHHLRVWCLVGIKKTSTFKCNKEKKRETLLKLNIKKNKKWMAYCRACVSTNWWALLISAVFDSMDCDVIWSLAASCCHWFSKCAMSGIANWLFSSVLGCNCFSVSVADLAFEIVPLCYEMQKWQNKMSQKHEKYIKQSQQTIIK